jgi:glycosyltransferase involved in cell wall biosynthesis
MNFNVLFICNGYIQDNAFVTASWIESLISQMTINDNFRLNIVCSSKLVNTVKTVKLKNVTIYLYPMKSENLYKYNINTENYLCNLIKIVNPDIVHIFGTEYLYCLSTINACLSLGIINKVVCSVQGFCSIIPKHYFSGLPYEIVNNYTFRDAIKQDNIKQQAWKFYLRGKNEVEALQKIKHVIGRTEFDRALLSQINPMVNYHICNETLRDQFYKHRWNYKNCLKNSIFFSQNYYPVKGFHYLLEALPMVKKFHPNLKVFTTGIDITKVSSLSCILRENSYQKYLRKLIRKLDLYNNIVFLGRLNEQEMCKQYLKTHIFVSSSTIENSSNSIGEAMILGVPIVSSDVGGTKSLLTHNIEGFLYQSDAPYMLSYYICESFSNFEKISTFSTNSVTRANVTHSKENNMNKLYEIYLKVYNAN